MGSEDAPGDGDLYVSPEGDDEWSGELAEPTDDGTDGPFRTIERAQRAVRERKADATLGNDLTVYLRGGRYRREEPLTFGPEDSAPVTYAASPGETPVIDGSLPIDGWEETTVNGVDAWTTTVDAVRDGEWHFRSLFVDGERRRRPRLPKAVDEVFEEGAHVTDEEERFYHFQEGTPEGERERTFVPEAGSIDPEWHNRDDVDVVTIDRWYDERAPVESVTTGADGVETVTLAIRPYPGKAWPGDRFYYVENVFEALSEPGEWYLDRETGELWYVPREGESIDDVTITAPRTRRLLRIEGEPGEDRPVEFLRFEGLTFAHTGWEHWEAPGWITGQSAAPTPGTISLRGARNVTLADCTVRTNGQYGLDLREGCRSVTARGCEFADLGAGGVKIGSYASDPATDARTERNRIVDNHVHDTGNVFHMGAGVMAMDTSRNEIAHNHVHDCYYTAISCGFDWGYRDPVAWENRIAHNHIHDLGKRLLSDMGGIYTLGVQPGTVLRNNHIHDVAANDYGGWGIYPDEGSSHLVIEDNVVHDTNRQAFHQHYGRENTVRNNVFAFGAESGITLSRAEEHVSFTFERNVVVVDDAPVFAAGYDWSLEPGHLISDLNLFHDVSGEALTCDQRGEGGPTLSFEEWRERGNDRHSVVADPEFVDLEGRDLSLSADSPAFDLGFEPIDLSDVGPRPPDER